MSVLYSLALSIVAAALGTATYGSALRAGTGGIAAFGLGVLMTCIVVALAPLVIP